MEFIDETEMNEYVNKMKYLVVYPDTSCKLYKSLRDITKEICVDSSTISKRMSNGENMVKAKGSEYYFYIKKL